MAGGGGIAATVSKLIEKSASIASGGSFASVSETAVAPIESVQ